MTEAQWLAGWDAAAMVRHLTRHAPAQGGDGLWVRRSSPLASDRKLRLFAVACCRQVWHLLEDGRSRHAVEAAERHADGRAAGEDLAAVCQDARAAVWGAATGTASAAANVALWVAANAAEMAARMVATQATARDKQAHLLRDIVGNPHRPVTLPAAPRCEAGCPRSGAPSEPDHRLPRVCVGCGHYWESPLLTPTVVSVAHAAYDSRDPQTGHLDTARLAVLADALEEAGCDDRAVLSHLRGLSPCAHDAGPCDDCGGTGWRPSPVPRYRGFWPLDLILGRE